MNEDQNPNPEPQNLPNPQGPQPTISPTQQPGSISPPSVYDGPVAQTNYSPSEYSASYNSNNTVVKKSNSKRNKILILVVVLLLGLGVLVFLLLSGSDDTSNNNLNVTEDNNLAIEESDDPEQASELDDSENLQEPPEEEVIDKAEPVVSPAAGDTVRKNDINSMFQKLEEFYNENAYYPTQTFSSTLFPGADDAIFVDANGLSIKQEAPKFSTTAPNSPFVNGKDPVEGQSSYAYQAYKCNSGVPGEAKCAGYVLSSWLETADEPYIKNSLN